MAIGEIEDASTQVVALFELGAQEVEARQPTQHAELLTCVATVLGPELALLEQVECPGVCVLDLGREAARRHEGTGKARAEGDLLADVLG